MTLKEAAQSVLDRANLQANVTRVVTYQDEEYLPFYEGRNNIGSRGMHGYIVYLKDANPTWMAKSTIDKELNN